MLFHRLDIVNKVEEFSLRSTCIFVLLKAVFEKAVFEKYWFNRRQAGGEGLVSHTSLPFTVYLPGREQRAS